MLKQIAHICIMSTDLDATERFYCDLFGLKKLFNFVKDDNIVGYYLGLGNNTSIEVFFKAQAAAAPNAIIDHICLEVEDMDTVVSHARANQVEITDKKLGCDKTWQAWLTDPCGVRIELFQYTAESSQFTGRDCIVDW